MSIEWIPKEGIDTSLHPTRLKDEEIDEILRDFPIPPSTDRITSLQIRRELVDVLRSKLRTIEIVPLREARERLRDDILQSYHATLMISSYNVGIATAGAFGSVLMQMALDTFHKAGELSSVGSGLKGMENILYAIKERKDRKCVIHFKFPVSKYDVLDLVPLVVDICLEDIIKDEPEYLDYATPEQREEVRKWWHWAYEQVNGQLPTPYYVLRIRLNLDTIYMHRLTLERVAKFISENSDVAAVYSPLSESTIDLFYPKLKFGGGGTAHTPSSQLAYLQYKLLPSISKLRIKGVPGIKSIHANSVSVVNLMNDDRRISRHEIEKYRLMDRIGEIGPQHGAKESRHQHFWRVEINMGVMRGTGAPFNSLVRLLQLSGVIIVNSKRNNYREWPLNGDLAIAPELQGRNNAGHYTELWCHIPGDDHRVTPTQHLTSWINHMKGEGYSRLLEEAEAAKPLQDRGELDQKWLDDFNMRWDAMTALIDEVVMLSTYTYATTEGTNLPELFKFPWVDTLRSYSNDAYEINALFGCEVARSYMAHELTQVLASSGISINSRHITLILDFMFTRGFPLGVRSSAAMTRSSRNFLSNSTSDRTFGIYVGASLHQLKEVMGSVPASLMVGELPRIGSNAFHHFPTPEDVAKEVQRIENERRKRDRSNIPQNLDPQSMEIAVQERTQLQPSQIVNVGEGVEVPPPPMVSTSQIQTSSVEVVQAITPQQLEVLRVNPILSRATAEVLRQIASNWKPLTLTTVEPEPCGQVLESSNIELPHPEDLGIQDYVPSIPPEALDVIMASGFPPELEERIQQILSSFPSRETNPDLGLIYKGDRDEVQRMKMASPAPHGGSRPSLYPSVASISQVMANIKLLGQRE